MSNLQAENFFFYCHARSHRVSVLNNRAGISLLVVETWQHKTALRYDTNFQRNKHKIWRCQQQMERLNLLINGKFKCVDQQNKIIQALIISQWSTFLNGSLSCFTCVHDSLSAICKDCLILITKYRNMLTITVHHYILLITGIKLQLHLMNKMNMTLNHLQLYFNVMQNRPMFLTLKQQ